MFRCIGFICVVSAFTSSAAQTPGTRGSSVLSAAVSVLPALTMNATVAKVLGTKTESGTVVLKLGSDGSFDEQWNLPDEKRSAHAGAPEVRRTCTATDGTGATSAVTSLSCFQSVPWFAPWAASLLQTAGVLTGTISQILAIPSTISSASVLPAPSSSSVVYQLPVPTEFLNQPATLRSAQSIATASKTTVISDGLTALPSQATFVEMIDGVRSVQNTLTYSDYRIESGLIIPHHITRALQGTVLYDIHVTSLVLN